MNKKKSIFILIYRHLIHFSNGIYTIYNGQATLVAGVGLISLICFIKLHYDERACPSHTKWANKQTLWIYFLQRIISNRPIILIRHFASLCQKLHIYRSLIQLADPSHPEFVSGFYSFFGITAIVVTNLQILRNLCIISFFKLCICDILVFFFRITRTNA